MAATGVWWLALGFCLADPGEADITERQRQQDRTTATAQDLVAEVLDRQVSQFAENGLTALPVYQDVLTMRTNLDVVARREMQEISQLLSSAQQVSGEQQTTLLQQARRQAADVVTVLLAEQERLRRRLSLAHLRAQVQQLIEQQDKLRDQTRQLPERIDLQRDAETLATLHAQRDLHQLYDQLLDELRTTQQSNPQQSQVAANSLRQLQERNVEQHFDAAESALGQSQSEDAHHHQSTVIDELRRLQDLIDSSQGLDPQAREAALEQIRQARQEQQSVRDDTQQTEAGDTSRLDALVQREQAVRRQLEDLEHLTASLPSAHKALQQAQTAAYEAEGELFSGDIPNASRQQQEVLDRLDQLQREVESATPSSPSADQAAQLLKQLERLEETLTQLELQQDQVIADAALRPADAQRTQQQVADRLEQEAASPQLPQSLQQALQQTADRAEQASETFQDRSPAAADARTAAAEAVQQLLQSALEETASQLQAARDAQQSDAASQGVPSPAPSTQSASSHQPTTGTPTPQPAAQANNSATSSSEEPGSLSRSDESQQTDAPAMATPRQVGDAQPAADDRTIPGDSTAVDAPWFARLPEGVREAMRSRGRPRLPRGYEERLRRYFESSNPPSTTESRTHD